MSGFHDMDYGWGGWLAMGTVMVVLWILVIGGSIWAVRTLAGDRGRTGDRLPRSSADEVLAQRFARGEIEEDDFRHRRDVLSASDHGRG